MAARYHISADGVARKCQAKTPEACKATIVAMRGQHFDSKPEAEQAYEKVNEEKTLKRHQKQTKNNRRSRLTDIKKTQRSSFSEEEIAEMHKKEKAEIALREAEQEKLEAELLAIEEQEIRAFRNLKSTAERADETRISLKNEYKGKLKDNDQLEIFQNEKNELTEKFKQQLTTYTAQANILEYDPYTYNRNGSRRYKTIFQPIDTISNSIHHLNSQHLSNMLRAKQEKLGIMDKVFTNKEAERDQLLMNGATDYIKNIYNPNDSKLVSDILESKEQYAVENDDAPSAQFVRNFIEKDDFVGEKVVVLKASDKNFPVADQKDYVHFANVDFTNYPDDHKKISEIYGKLSTIKTKMIKYDQMLKDHGEEADPEVVQSAKMTFAIGEQKASDIIGLVKEQEKTRKQTEDFYNNSNDSSNKELDETELDLFHEIKSTSF